MKKQHHWSKSPTLSTPTNGPGHTPPTLIRFATPTPDSAPISNSTMRGVYDGAELRTTPGLTPDSLHAYRLPSRVGNRLHYPDGRVERLEA